MCPSHSEAALQLANELNALESSSIMWAFGRMATGNMPEASILLDQAGQKLHLPGPQETSNTLWGPAIMASPDLSMFHTLGTASVKRQLEGQSLASIFWWPATVESIGQLPVQKPGASFVASPQTCGPVEAANIGWSVGTLRHLGRLLAEVLMHATVVLNVHSAPQELASVAWTFAVPGVQDEQLLVALRKAGLRAVPCMDVRGIAGMSWASVTLVVDAAAAAGSICKRLELLLVHFEAEWQPQSLASTARLSSSSAGGGVLLIDETARLSCRLADGFTATEAGMLSLSLVRCGRLDHCWTFIDALFAQRQRGDCASLASASLGPLLAAYGDLGDAEGFSRSLRALVVFGELSGLDSVGSAAAGMVLAELGRADEAVELLQTPGHPVQNALARACGVYIDEDFIAAGTKV